MRHWVDGSLREAGQARVSLFDRGFLLGDAVFDTTRGTRDSAGRVVPFARDRHVARLVRNASAIGISVDSAAVDAALEAVCEANPELGHGGRIRSMVTSGIGPPGVPAAPGGRLFILAIPPNDQGQPGGGGSTGASRVQPGLPVEAAEVAIAPWPRNQHGALAGIKSASFGENLMCLRHAHSVGAGESLVVNLAGEVVEGSTSNLFVVLHGGVATPPLGSGCLPGVTRELLIEWAADADVRIVEREIRRSDIPDFKEAFLTSAIRGVQPIATIKDDMGVPLWSGTSHGQTAQLAALMAQRSEAEWNP